MFGMAYLDGGMIYSHDNGTSIRTNIVLRNCQPEYVNGALLKVFYTDISDPFNPVNDSVLFPLDTIKENGSYLLKNSDIVHLAGAIRVTAIIVDVPQCSVSNIDSTMHNISRGQNLVLNCNLSINNLGSIEKPVSASYEISYALESVSIDGEGRILQHRTGDSVTYSYDYYLKDHMGSTRMVINDQNQITEAIAYQPYGTIVPLDDIVSSPQTPTRQQFTGKEFDREGGENGVEGIQAYYFVARMYDPEIGMFLSTDPVGQFANAYSYTGGNPIMFVDPDGEWAGALIGAVAGAYIGGVMSNLDAQNPFKPWGSDGWDWSNPGTYMGMFSGALSGAMLGHGIEMRLAGTSGNFTDAYQGTGSVEHSSQGMKVIREGAIEANDLEKFSGKKLSDHIQGKQDSRLSRFLGHDKLEYKIGASSSGQYEIVAGTRNSVSTPPSWINKYDLMMHSHPVGTGHSIPSYGQGYSKVPNDFATVRNLRAAGYTGTHALYVPDTRTFYGYNSIFSNGMVNNTYWELLNVLPLP